MSAENILNMLDVLTSPIYRTTEEQINRLKEVTLRTAMKQGDGRGVYTKCALRGMEFFKGYKAVLEEAVKNSRVTHEKDGSAIYRTTKPQWRKDFLISNLTKQGFVAIASFLWIVSHQLDYEGLLDDADVIPSLSNEQAYLKHMNALKELKNIHNEDNFLHWMATKFGSDSVLDLVKGTPLESMIEVIHV